MKRFLPILISILVSINLPLAAQTQIDEQTQAEIEKLESLGEQLFEEQDFAGAMDVVKEILTLIETSGVGTDNEQYAESLNDLGVVHYMLGNYEEALKFCQQALEITKIVSGIQSSDYAKRLYNISFVYSRINNYEESLKCLLQVSAIQKDILGESHIDYGETLFALGYIYKVLNNLDQALMCFQSSLDIYSAESKIDSLLNILENIGSIFKEQKRYKEALPYYEEALDIRRGKLDKMQKSSSGDLDYISTLVSTADICVNVGYFNKCLLYCDELYQFAVGTEFEPIAKQVVSAVDLVIGSSDNWGNTFDILLKELATIENQYGKISDEYIRQLFMIARAYYDIYDIKTVEYAQQALAIDNELYGDEKKDIRLRSVIKSLIGDYYLYIVDDWLQAIEYYLESSIYTGIDKGYDSRAYLLSTMWWCDIYAQQGLYEEALNHALYYLSKIENNPEIEPEMYDGWLLKIGKYYHFLGQVDNAAPYIEKVYKTRTLNYHKGSDLYLSSVLWQAISLKNQGRTEEAIELYESILGVITESVLDNFLFLDEDKRTKYWDNYKTYFELLYRFVNLSESYNNKYTQLAYNSSLFTKGLLLNSLVEHRKMILQSGDLELIEIFNKLNIVSERLATNTLGSIEYNQLTTQKDSLNTVLMSRSRDVGDFTRNLSVDWTQVQGSLGKKDVAVEFIDYKLWNDTETYYAALVLRKGMEHPIMVELTTESKIVYEMRNKEQIYTGEPARIFYNEIWAALEPYINKGDNVYFSPSGLLHQLNIEFFANEDVIAANEVYNLHRLSSTRQLCIEHDDSKAKSAVLYGGLYYDADSTVLVANSRSWESGAIRTRAIAPAADSSERSKLEYLKGSRTEVDDIELKLKSKKVSPTKYIEFAGNEESFKALSEQRTPIIHIATHGFFLKNEESDKTDYFKLQMIGDQQHTPRDNSMKRSGLLLSGAQKAWLREAVPEGVEDGILLAEEIATLDLRGTNLVVLSCCETGLGEVTSEGVFGLQRAFKMAGVETLIMSLWRVDDEATTLMMQTFYDSLLSGKSRRDSFLAAQQKLKQTYDDPYYWAAFIMLD